MSARVFGGGTTLEVAGGTGKETNLIDGRCDLILDQGADGLAGVFTLDGRDLFGVGLEGIGNSEQRELSLTGGVLTPVVECRIRRFEGSLDVGLVGIGRGCIDLAVGWVDDVERAV